MPKAASIVVDSMLAVVGRYNTCPDPKPTRVVVHCPPLLEFIGENKLRMRWVLMTLQNSLPDGFYTVTADAEPVRGFTFAELLGWKVDDCLPKDGPIALIALNIQRFAGPPDSD